MDKSNKIISANVSYDTAKKIQSLADYMGVSVSTVVRNVLQDPTSPIAKQYLESVSHGKL